MILEKVKTVRSTKTRKESIKRAIPTLARVLYLEMSLPSGLKSFFAPTRMKTRPVRIGRWSTTKNFVFSLHCGKPLHLKQVE